MVWNVKKANLCRHWFRYVIISTPSHTCGEIKKLTWIFHFFPPCPHPIFENSKIMKFFRSYSAAFIVSRETNFKYFLCVRGHMTFFYCNRFWFCILFLFKYEPQLWFSHSLLLPLWRLLCRESQCHWDWKKMWRGEKIDFEYGIFFRQPHSTI